MSAAHLTLPPPDVAFMRRKERYIGEEVGAPLSAFGAPAASAIQNTYALLQLVLRACEDAIREQSPLLVLDGLVRHKWAETLAEFRRHVVVHSADGTADLPRLCHDLRSGALANAAIQADLMRVFNTEVTEEQVMRLLYLCRDHLKIMRHCVRDLDPETRSRDLETNYHSTALLKEKWGGFESDGTRIEYERHAEAVIACCCMEFSTVDRIAYNLVNNALAHSAGGTVFIGTALFKGPNASDHVQIYTRNAIDRQQQERLRAELGDDLGTLFRGGFTTGGHGLGLKICAELVGNAYGIFKLGDTIRSGLVRAMIEDDHFIALVHWPVFA